MEVSNELLFFFSALGAFNGLLMGLYFLFYAKPRHISNYFLGALLLTLSIRIGKSVFFYFNNDLAGVYIHIGLVACSLIGPALYFYLKSVILPEDNHRHEWKYHLAVLVPTILIVSYLFPWKDYRPLWQHYILDIIYFEWFAYLIVSSFLMAKVYRQFRQRPDKLNSVEIWLMSVFLGTVIIFIVYQSCAYTSYITGAVSFTFILYLLVLLIVFNKKKEVILFKLPAKYGDKKIKAKEVNILTKQLATVMQEEKLYKNPSLKLPDVAQKLNILPHRLSQLINENLGKSFSLYINEYRVDEAKIQLLTNEDYTLEAIGYECGFNSKSSFYSTFKKLAGTTPAKYKRQKVS